MVKKVKGLETKLQGKQKIHLGFLFCFSFDAGDGTRGLTHCRPLLYHWDGWGSAGEGTGMMSVLIRVYLGTRIYIYS